MTIAAIKLKALSGGAEALSPEAGVDGLAICQPTVEASLGDDPPIAPSLVTAAQPIGNQLRSRRTGTMALVTSPLRKKVRGTWQVMWPTMTTSQRNAMVAWIAQGVRGRQLGWTLRPDGREGEAVTVRFLTDPQSLWKDKHAHDAPVSAMVEELFTSGVGAVTSRPT